VAQSAAVSDRKYGVDRALVVGALVLVLLTALAIVSVLRFAEGERERELRAWQVRLGIVADSRFAAVDGWLTAQLEEMTGLAENASLQLYLSQLALAADETERDLLAEAQADYLRNLLVVSAERGGFAPPSAVSPIGANVERIGVSGIALLDVDGRVLVATPAMPPAEGPLAAFVVGLQAGQRGVMDLHLNAAGRPAMAFAAPVFAVQEDPGASTQIGYVLGVKEVAAELYPLLEQPGETAATAHALLVRAGNEVVEYLSPLPDGTAPLTLKMARNTPELDAAFALETPGSFSSRRDYRNRDVLMVSRGFSQVPWALIYEIERGEALADSEARLNSITTVLIVCILAAVAAMIAFWRHGSSRRAASAARQSREMAERFEHQRNLLRLVTDSQPTAIFILDEDGRYRFANSRASQRAGIPAMEMLGKPIVNVLGPDAARRYLALNRQVLESGNPDTETTRADLGGAPHVLQSDHIPIAATTETPRGVLVVESDITEAVTERERRTRIERQLVRTLVDAVDRRDPFAAAHSTRVALVARAIAGEMGLDARAVETAETAGNLLNLGKILIERDLLTRSGQLSEAERQEVRHSLQAGADLLQGVEFDGPVVETLRQAQAHWDGSGMPAGLAGDDILVSARIIAVANAFIGMVSPRAHRAALSIDQAVAELLRQVGVQFDRSVVAAFVSWLDNHGGRDEIAALQRPGSASSV
jgi:PAS domain S-box-containing protein